ncbi:C25 family cysteine peptidase [Polyangium sp. 6x1]|uniref:C25 family cysteine peptidase n=1 Tax=Polyangium sp. 6x1 TaxID=3042689 RepID=UPI002482FDFC|nr:C25 family cysteine peptidase [Polyangium sp. 6x1]MDI1443866.1 C25 family cysteine peptidase [Polyangium sp. 6x1]
MRVRRFARIGVFLGLVGCGAADPQRLGGATNHPSGSAAAKARADVDYIAIGPRALLEGIEPLLAHREGRGLRVARVFIEDLAPKGGKPLSPEQIAGVIRETASRAGKRLRFVLLVGDAPGYGESLAGATFVPTFYRPKLGYENHDHEEHAFFTSHMSDEDRGFYHYMEEIYPTDHPYALAHVNAPGQPDLAAERSPTPLAVGRVPARTPSDALGFAKKVVEYETARPQGAWRRSIALFSGPANFGAVADFLIERTMTRILDDDVPYDWDVDLVVPQAGSPYAYPFPMLRDRLVERLDAGALIAGYVGHGAPMFLDDARFNGRRYNIGNMADFKRLRIGEGKPFFVSITCNTGFFDLRNDHRSVAEALVMNPEGAIAAFASSRESHPYPNALYGEAIVETFVEERAPTIGEGVVKVKRRMREGEVPLAPLLFQSDPEALAEEHMGLYNLLGDPATVLQYPASAKVLLASGPEPRAPGAEVAIAVEAPGIPTGTALLTVETKRSVVRTKVLGEAELRAMPEDEAWDVLRKTYAAASDKVISRMEEAVTGGRAAFRVKLPAEAGEYVLKVFAAGSGQAATGHARVKVAAPPR